MSRLLARLLLVSAVATVALATVAVSAKATTAPARWYTLTCPKLGYWGNRIIATPSQIDTQPGVGSSIVDGSGLDRSVGDQYIYYAVWAYSYKYQTWYHSAPKRVLDGYPGVVEAYDTTIAAWKPVSGGFAGEDLAVGPNAVSLPPNTGSGTWRIAVETYWAPPFVTWTSSMSTNPSPFGGGLDIFDSSNSLCTF